MLIPLRPGELPRLIPAVATGPQFNACTGNPEAVLRRVLISVIGAVVTLLISQTLLFSSQFGSVFLVTGVVFALYLLCGPDPSGRPEERHPAPLSSRSHL